MSDKFQIQFGAMVDPIRKQLKEQGFDISKDRGRFFDRLADAITLLSVHCLLTEKEKGRLRKRLMKIVSKNATR